MVLPIERKRRVRILPAPKTQMLTLQEAKEQRRCRICGELIPMQGLPEGIEDKVRDCLCPIKVAFNGGKEFAHTACLAVAESSK